MVQPSATKKNWSLAFWTETTLFCQLYVTAALGAIQRRSERLDPVVNQLNGNHIFSNQSSLELKKKQPKTNEKTTYLQYMRIPTRITRQIKVRADTTTSGITVFFSDSRLSARPIRDSWLLLLASAVREN